MTNRNLLRILFVEDLNSDVDLAVLELKKENLKFEYYTVCTRADLIKAFKEFKPDLVISDFMMPSYDGMQALLDSKEINPQIPFILFTGSVNEETAVRCIQAGADDYIIKEHLTRLPYAVKEVLEKSLKEKEKKAAELLLKENEEKLQSIFRAAPVGIGLAVNRVFMEVNDTFCTMTGYTHQELIGKSAEMIYATKEEFERVGIDVYGQIAEKGIGSVETRFKCKDGRIIHVLSNSTPLDKSDLTKGVTSTTMDITERVHAEEALHKSQHLFQILAQVSPVGIFRTDPEGNTTYVNPKWIELAGLSSEEAIGDGWLNAVHHEDREKLREEWLINFKHKDESGAEYRFLRPDGSTVWVMGKAVPELINNEVIGYIGTITDITERKQSEEALRESERKYRQLVTQSPDGIFIIDLSGKFLSANRAICEGLNYTEEELISKNILDIVPERYHALHKQRFMAIINGESTSTNAEYEVIGKNGKAHFVEVLSVPYYKGEKIVGFQGIARDIAERKKAEEILRSSEERLKILFDHAPDAYYLNDLKGTFIDGNIACEKLMGYNRNELIGRNFLHLNLLSLKQLPRATKNLVKNSLGQSTGPDEFVLNRKDGIKVTVEILTHPVKIKNQTLVLGMARDITERKRAEEELIKAKEKAEEGDRLKTAFLHNISHEIRTPMNAIVGFSALLGEPDVDTQSRKDYIGFIMQSSNHLLTIISDILDISNIEANLVNIVKNKTNVNSMLQSLCDQFIPKADEKNIKLVCETALSDADALVLTDSTKLKQVLINLVSNAIKFTDKGHVKVGCVLTDKFLEFNVSDTGIGISEDYRQKIFDRFYQVQLSESKLNEGTGLGLPISKAHVELMGGKLWLTSEPGKGSSFCFTVPYEKHVVETLAVNEKRVPEEFVFPEKKTILVAEDTDSNFKLIAYFLSDTNTKLLWAKNGKEAVEIALKDRNIDLILMDIKMPVMDGYTAVELIRAANTKIPIIAQTAYADDRKKAFEVGCNGFILKPLDKMQLIKTMCEFI